MSNKCFMVWWASDETAPLFTTWEHVDSCVYWWIKVKHLFAPPHLIRGGPWLCWDWGSLWWFWKEVWALCVFCIQPLGPGLNLQSTPSLSFIQMEGTIYQPFPLNSTSSEFWTSGNAHLESFTHSFSLVMVRYSLDGHVWRFKFPFMDWPHQFLKLLFCAAPYCFRPKRKANRVGAEKLHI